MGEVKTIITSLNNIADACDEVASGDEYGKALGMQARAAKAMFPDFSDWLLKELKRESDGQIDIDPDTFVDLSRTIAVIYANMFMNIMSLVNNLIDDETIRKMHGINESIIRELVDSGIETFSKMRNNKNGAGNDAQ